MGLYFSKFLKFFCLGVFFLFSFTVSAQIKVLIYADSTFDKMNRLAIRQLKENGKALDIDFKTTYDITEFSLEMLTDFQCIVFLNAGVENLNLKQSNVLLNYFKQGGGFVGIHGALKRQYKWLWFQNQINANLAGEASQTSQISIITNKQLEGLTILPYWKMLDKPFKVSNVSKSCKPILLDFSSNPLSWVSNTPIGNKSFYTSLGGTKESWENEIFIKHLLGGIFEVASKKQNSEVQISSYPADSEFQTHVLIDSISNPQAFINLSESKILLVYNKGNIGIFDLYLHTFSKIGFESKLENVVKITKDPDFESNNNLFCFTKTTESDFLVNKISYLNDSITISEIELNSENHDLFKTKMNSGLSDDNLLGFPKYYIEKTFDLDLDGKIIIETVNEFGETINKEPFPFLNQNEKILDIGFDNYNTFYTLNNRSLLITYYSKQGFPKLFSPQINIEKNVLIKLSLNQEVEIPTNSNIEWIINGQIIGKNKSLNFPIKKSGTYEIEFKNYFGERLIQKVGKHFLIKISKK